MLWFYFCRVLTWKIRVARSYSRQCVKPSSKSVVSSMCAKCMLEGGSMWLLKIVVFFMCDQRAHADLPHTIILKKTWLYSVLKIIKRWHFAFGELYSENMTVVFWRL